jgi:GR25 family glycosyltransferase involved in LPS biosynthesis
MNIHDFLLQVPLALHLALAKSMNLIYQPYVPTAMIMIAENNDDVRVEVYHEIPDAEKKEKLEPDRSTIISNAHRITIVERQSTKSREIQAKLHIKLQRHQCGKSRVQHLLRSKRLG